MFLGEASDCKLLPHQGIIMLFYLPDACLSHVALLSAEFQESVLFSTDWCSGLLFQTTISGPTVKNNSLHGNIPLVKVDAATSV